MLYLGKLPDKKTDKAKGVPVVTALWLFFQPVLFIEY